MLSTDCAWSASLSEPPGHQCRRHAPHVGLLDRKAKLAPGTGARVQLLVGTVSACGPGAPSIYRLTFVNGRRTSRTAFEAKKSETTRQPQSPANEHRSQIKPLKCFEPRRELGTPQICAVLNPRSRLRENERFGGLPCDEVPVVGKSAATYS